MNLAIPITGGTMTQRLGQCESYLFVTIDCESGTVQDSKTAVAPPHAPDHLPDWLVKQGVDTLVAPAIPDKFRILLEFHGLKVLEHPEPIAPLDLIQEILDGNLGDEACS